MTAAIALAATTALTGPAAFATSLPGLPSASEIAATDAQRAKELPPSDDVDRAIAQAKASRKSVPVDSLTTESSETIATPDGHLTRTSHVDPQRVKRDGTWQALDATLAANADGSFSPKAAAGDLVLYKGGDGPLATMTSADGKKLALSAPFKLPAPTASGDSVLYPSVAPDIDLKVTATKLGGLTTVLVVKTQAAAANPILKNLHFDTTADGLSVTTDPGGNITATAADGKPRFLAPTPQMWDSTTVTAPAAAQPRAAAQAPAAGSDGDASKAAPASTAAGPGIASKVAAMPVKAGGTGIDLTPDQDLLAHGTAPYYIDPAWLPWSQSGNAWTWVQSANPGTSNWGRTGTNDSDYPGVGICGYYPNGDSCSPSSVYRSFFQFDISPIAGAIINSATMNMQEYVSADWTCSNTYPLDLYLMGSAISSSTTWNNQPGQLGGSLGHQTIGGSGHTGCYNNVPFSYTITGTMQQYVNNGQLTFGLYGDESNQNAFKRFTYQPALSITYDRTPNTPTNPGTSPAPKTVNPAQTNQACDNTSGWSWLGAGSDQANAVSLNATVSSPTQAQLYSWSHIWDYNQTGMPDVAGGYSAPVASGSTASYVIPAGVLKDGHGYGYGIMASDQLPGVPWSASTPTCHFMVDLTPPTVTFPTTVTDPTKQFPPSGNGQTTTLYVGQTGGVPFTATDPNPSGLNSSGVACLRWSFDPQLVDGSWQCGSSMPTGQIPTTPSRWGTNILYVQAEDNAGNLSPVTPYSFYVPWNPNSPAPTFGDVTGDALPDIVTADPNGDLRSYSIPATGQKAVLSATKANSPGGDSWANYRVTHRGSLRGGSNVDDLIVHKNYDPNLYVYPNPGNTGVPGVFDNHKTLTKPACDPKVTDCTGYNATDWSTTGSIAASGDPSTTSLNTSNKFQHRTGLFSLESYNGSGILWFYPAVGDNVLGSPSKVISPMSMSFDLISPGDWTGSGHPGLMARLPYNGELHGYTFSTGTVSGTDAFGNSTTYPTFTTLTASNIITTGISTTTWPTVGSDGDLTGIGSPTLWGVTPNGTIQIWTGHSTTTYPNYTWTTGPTGVLSTYAANSPIALAAQTGKCIDITGASTAPGTAVQLFDCNSTPGQNWTFQPDGTLRALGSCLDAFGGGTTNGTLLDLWPCANGAYNQIFLPRADGTLYNPASGRCIDLPGGTTTNGTRPQLFDCNGTPAQKWALPVRSSS